jgi:hypothetical protein
MKFPLEQATKAQKGSRGIVLLFSLISALDVDGDGWSTPRPDGCAPGKQSRYTMYLRLGGPQGRSERVRKISHPPGFDPRTVQPAVSEY